MLIVDTVGFSPGLLTGSTLHSDRLHVVERFTFDPDKVAITRSYAADDPLYFVGQLTGSDTILVADVGYSPDPCTELTFVDYSREGQAAAPASEPRRRPKRHRRSRGGSSGTEKLIGVSMSKYLTGALLVLLGTHRSPRSSVSHFAAIRRLPRRVSASSRHRASP